MNECVHLGAGELFCFVFKVRILPGADEDRVAVHLEQFEVIGVRSVAVETLHMFITFTINNKNN